jgi:mRNA-degrading endonuclease YafQ of YafQ-DinJ toxin-antitoxin module
VEIDFDNPKHERPINDYEALRKRYNKTKGVDSASDILATMDILRAANTLADIPQSYHPHPLKGEYKGTFAVDVDKKHRIIFKPNHNADSDFRIDNPKTIRKITIKEIYKDYHKP